MSSPLAESEANTNLDEWDSIKLGINSTINKTIQCTSSEVILDIKLSIECDCCVNNVTKQAKTDVTKPKRRRGWTKKNNILCSIMK